MSISVASLFGGGGGDGAEAAPPPRNLSHRDGGDRSSLRKWRRGAAWRPGHSSDKEMAQRFASSEASKRQRQHEWGEHTAVKRLRDNATAVLARVTAMRAGRLEADATLVRVLQREPALWSYAVHIEARLHALCTTGQPGSRMAVLPRRLAHEAIVLATAERFGVMTERPPVTRSDGSELGVAPVHCVVTVASHLPTTGPLCHLIRRDPGADVGGGDVRECNGGEAAEAAPALGAEQDGPALSLEQYERLVLAMAQQGEGNGTPIATAASAQHTSLTDQQDVEEVEEPVNVADAVAAASPTLSPSEPLRRVSASPRTVVAPATVASPCAPKQRPISGARAPVREPDWDDVEEPFTLFWNPRWTVALERRIQRAERAAASRAASPWHGYGATSTTSTTSSSSSPSSMSALSPSLSLSSPSSCRAAQSPNASLASPIHAASLSHVRAAAACDAAGQDLAPLWNTGGALPLWRKVLRDQCLRAERRQRFCALPPPLARTPRNVWMIIIHNLDTFADVIALMLTCKPLYGLINSRALLLSLRVRMY